ncbi:MAG: hypothetical protein QW194_03785 [Candidatus Micrarchaeaceae archaeon]
MEYRKIKAEDIEKVIEFCNDSGVRVPDNADIIFVAAKDDEIHGVVGVKRYICVEPLAATSGVVALVLGEKALSALQVLNVPHVYALVKSSNSKMIDMLEEYGFEIQDRDIVILHKRLG